MRAERTRPGSQVPPPLMGRGPGGSLGPFQVCEQGRVGVAACRRRGPQEPAAGAPAAGPRRAPLTVITGGPKVTSAPRHAAVSTPTKQFKKFSSQKRSKI